MPCKSLAHTATYCTWQLSATHIVAAYWAIRALWILQTPRMQFTTMLSVVSPAPPLPPPRPGPKINLPNRKAKLFIDQILCCRLQDGTLALLQPDLPSAGATQPHTAASAFPVRIPLPHGKKRTMCGFPDSSDSLPVDNQPPSRLLPARQLSLPAYRHGRPSSGLSTTSDGRSLDGGAHKDSLAQKLPTQHRPENSSLATSAPFRCSGPLAMPFWERQISGDSRPVQQQASADLDISGSDGFRQHACQQPRTPRPRKQLRKAKVSCPLVNGPPKLLASHLYHYPPLYGLPFRSSWHCPDVTQHLLCSRIDRIACQRTLTRVAAVITPASFRCLHACL